MTVVNFHKDIVINLPAKKRQNRIKKDIKFDYKKKNYQLQNLIENINSQQSSNSLILKFFS